MERYTCNKKNQERKNKKPYHGIAAKTKQHDKKRKKERNKQDSFQRNSFHNLVDPPSAYHFSYYYRFDIKKCGQFSRCKIYGVLSRHKVAESGDNVKSRVIRMTVLALWA